MLSYGQLGGLQPLPLTDKLTLITTAFNGTEIRSVNHPERGMLLHAVDVLEVCGYHAKHSGAAKHLNGLAVPVAERITIKRNTLIISEGMRFQGPHGIFLTRAGVHQLLMASTKPAAKEFREWLAGEVVVAIADTGGYLLNEAARETAKADKRETVPLPEGIAKVYGDLIAAKKAQHEAEVGMPLTGPLGGMKVIIESASRWR